MTTIAATSSSSSPSSSSSAGENKRLVNGPLFDTYLNEQQQTFSNNNRNANNLRVNEIDRDDYHKLVNVNLNDQQYRNEIYRNSHLIMSKQNLIANHSNYYGASFSLSSQIIKQPNEDNNDQTNYLSNQCPFLDDPHKVNNNFSIYEAKPIQLNSNTKQSPFFTSNTSADSQKDNNNVTNGHQQISCV
jgi:hypothetical protein